MIFEFLSKEYLGAKASKLAYPVVRFCTLVVDICHVETRGPKSEVILSFKISSKFWCSFQEALQAREAATQAAVEALQEASAAESVLRSLRQGLGIT